MTARILVALVLPASGSAQATGTVSGVIKVAPDQPLARAVIWSVVGTRIHGATTDLFGGFVVESVPAGSVTFEVLCPTPVNELLAITPVAMKREVTVSAGRDTDLSSTLEPGACEPLPARSVRGRWRGLYSSAFEESSFTPCPDDSISREVRSYGHPFRRKAWVEIPANVWKKPGAGDLANDLVSSRGFVEWSGVLHGPAISGHMGMSNYRLVVDSIFSMSPTGRCDKR